MHILVRAFSPTPHVTVHSLQTLQLDQRAGSEIQKVYQFSILLKLLIRRRIKRGGFKWEYLGAAKAETKYVFCVCEGGVRFLMKMLFCQRNNFCAAVASESDYADGFRFDLIKSKPGIPLPFIDLLWPDRQLNDDRHPDRISSASGYSHEL